MFSVGPLTRRTKATWCKPLVPFWLYSEWQSLGKHAHQRATFLPSLHYQTHFPGMNLIRSNGQNEADSKRSVAADLRVICFSSVVCLKVCFGTWWVFSTDLHHHVKKAQSIHPSIHPPKAAFSKIALLAFQLKFSYADWLMTGLLLVVMAALHVQSLTVCCYDVSL